MSSHTQFSSTRTPSYKNTKKRSQFDLIIEEQMKKNEYDYKKMMDDFELETRRKKMFNGIRSKWQSISKGYLEKIEEMKLKNEKLYKERNRKFKQKIKRKNLPSKTKWN